MLFYAISIPFATFGEFQQFEQTVKQLFNKRNIQLPIRDDASVFEYIEYLHLVFPWQEKHVQMYFEHHYSEELYAEALFYIANSLQMLPSQESSLHCKELQVASLIIPYANANSLPSVQLDVLATTNLKVLAIALGKQDIVPMWYRIVEGTSSLSLE